MLALLALSAPVAGAMPLGDDGTTAAPTQDLRNPDQQAPAPGPYQDLRNPDQRITPPVPLTPYAPVELTKPAPVADDGGSRRSSSSRASRSSPCSPPPSTRSSRPARSAARV